MAPRCGIQTDSADRDFPVRREAAMNAVSVSDYQSRNEARGARIARPTASPASASRTSIAFRTNTGIEYSAPAGCQVFVCTGSARTAHDVHGHIEQDAKRKTVAIPRFAHMHSRRASSEGKPTQVLQARHASSFSCSSPRDDGQARAM